MCDRPGDGSDAMKSRYESIECLEYDGVLTDAAKTAVHQCSDPYLGPFYWRLRGEKNKPAMVARVVTARKLLEVTESRTHPNSYIF